VATLNSFGVNTYIMGQELSCESQDNAESLSFRSSRSQSRRDVWCINKINVKRSESEDRLLEKLGKIYRDKNLFLGDMNPSAIHNKKEFSGKMRIMLIRVIVDERS
jgi:hypothetical protein